MGLELISQCIKHVNVGLTYAHIDAFSAHCHGNWLEFGHWELGPLVGCCLDQMHQQRMDRHPFTRQEFVERSDAGQASRLIVLVLEIGGCRQPKREVLHTKCFGPSSVCAPDYSDIFSAIFHLPIIYWVRTLQFARMPTCNGQWIKQVMYLIFARHIDAGTDGRVPLTGQP